MSLYLHMSSFFIRGFKGNKRYRNYLIFYINRKASRAKKSQGNPNFFTWRSSGADYRSKMAYFDRAGFVIYKVYYKWERRETGETGSELIHTNPL